MATVNTYDIGDVPELFIAYTVPVVGTAVDPLTVSCLVLDPAGHETTYVYGTDANLTKASAGHYSCTIVVDQSGQWLYRWVSTGSPGQAEDEGKLKVRPTDFYPGI